MITMGPVLDLDHMKSAFTTLVSQAEPNILPAFMLWVDFKVSEFKISGAGTPSYIETSDKQGRKSTDQISNSTTSSLPVYSNSQSYTTSPDGATDLSMKSAKQHHRDNNAQVTSNTQKSGDDSMCDASGSRKSLKSIIDNIVKHETLSTLQPMPLDLQKHMHLPVAVPLLPPAVALAHSQFALSKFLNGNCPPKYGDVPELKPLKHSIPMTSGEVSSPKKFRDEHVNERDVSEGGALCLSKKVSVPSLGAEGSVVLPMHAYPTPPQCPPPPPVIQEGSFFPQLVAVKQQMPESPAKSSNKNNNNYNHVEKRRRYTKRGLKENKNLNSGGAEHVLSRSRKSRVTSALRDLLTSKLASSQQKQQDQIPPCSPPPPVHSDLDTSKSEEPEGFDVDSRLVIDEDRCPESPTEAESGALGDEDFSDSGRHPNKCAVCGQCFQYRSSFRRHMKVHQGIFSHVCAICGRKFTRKEHFIRHKCSRKPNKASRGAHSEVTNPTTCSSPKVEFPPTTAQASSPSCYSEDGSTDGYRSDSYPLPAIKVSNNKSLGSVESRRKAAVPRKVVMVDETEKPEEDGSYGDEDEIAMETENSPSQSYEEPCTPPPPPSHDIESPTKSEDLSMSPRDERRCSPELYYSPRKDLAMAVTTETLSDHDNSALIAAETILDLSCPQVTSSSASPPAHPHSTSCCHDDELDGSPTSAAHPGCPTGMAQGLPPQQEFTINTGSYKVVTSSGPDASDTNSGPVDRSNQYIKVVKQGNYLRLKEEAQVIAGRLCFVCPTCGKIFHRSSNFSRHMRIHRGVYSYVCPSCQRGFFRREHFQKHKCNRRGMSQSFDRKTKIDMVLAAIGQEGSDAEGASDTADSEESFPMSAGYDLTPDLDNHGNDSPAQQDPTHLDLSLTQEV